jgi:hypothetical protein
VPDELPSSSGPELGIAAEGSGSSLGRASCSRPPPDAEGVGVGVGVADADCDEDTAVFPITVDDGASTRNATAIARTARISSELLGQESRRIYGFSGS